MLSPGPPERWSRQNGHRRRCGVRRSAIGASAGNDPTLDNGFRSASIVDGTDQKISWSARKDGRHMPNRSLTREQILTLLAETPTRIAALTAGLPSAQLHAAPNQDEWSANDVLAHLRACADVWGTCIETMIAEDGPTLRAVNPRSWIKKTDYPELEFQSSLRAFATQRADLLAILGSLLPEAWSRAATVTGAGKPLERTVLFYARWLAVHERPHVKQIERIVKMAPIMPRPHKAST
jgi:hypothetical protein